MRHIVSELVGLLVVIVLVAPTAAHAQHVIPGYGVDDGYYGYGYHASTVGEGYGRGVADVIRSQGIYQQLSADAAVRLEEARRQSIENYKNAIQTYFHVRDQNRARRAAESAERRYQTLRWIRERKPAYMPRLSATQLDATTGEISWPAVLMDAFFAQQRVALERLFAKRAQQGGLYSIADRQAVQTSADELRANLRKRINEIHPQDYILAKHFVAALANEVF